MKKTKKSVKTSKKPTLKKKVKVSIEEPKTVAFKNSKSEYIPQSAIVVQKVETDATLDKKESVVLLKSDSVSFLHKIFYLLCIFVAIQILLWVYLVQNANNSLHQNYRFAMQNLNSCLKKNRKSQKEFDKFKEQIETACPEPQDRHEVINPAEYVPYEKGGSAVIEGSFCVKLTDNTEKCFEKTQVFINPVTSYSDEWYHRGWAGREALKQADPRAIKMNKSVLTEKDGKFKFEGLAAGSYYVGAVACIPKNAKDDDCVLSRFATKVTLKNRTKATLKRVFP